MEESDYFKNFNPYVNFQDERYGKSTLFENEHMLVGLNCLKPGQRMEKHAHEIQNRFYIVLEGNGIVGVGGEQKESGKGMVIWIPSGHTHWIQNSGTESMVLLVGISDSKTD
jgi:quercetin dioxygenase-like cupin family protein